MSDAPDTSAEGVERWKKVLLSQVGDDVQNVYNKDSLLQRTVEMMGALAAERDALRAALAQCRGMADEGSAAWAAAFRWCERIEEVAAAEKPLPEYEEWAWPRTPRQEGDT